MMSYTLTLVVASMLHGAPASQSSQPPATSPVSQASRCVSIGLDPERTWTFTPSGSDWTLTHRSGPDSRPVSLLLPKATATFGPRTVSVTSRTGNGGIDVRLEGTRDRATLDIYISYELEVNVDTSLTPEIDELNTHGRIGVRCAPGGEEQ